jgi:chromosome segregation ATPase
MPSFLASKQRREGASAGVILLIFLAASLCCLVAFQWYRDAALRQEIAEYYQQLTGLNNQKNEMERAGKRVEEELKRVESLRERLTELDKTNKMELSRSKKELAETSLKLTRAIQEGVSYEIAYRKMTNDIVVQNESLRRLNEAYLKGIALQKDTVEKYFKLATDCEALSLKYNTLFAQAEKLQQALNAPSEKK